MPDDPSNPVQAPGVIPLQPGWAAPGYAGDSIANLMSSLLEGLGADAQNHSRCPALLALTPETVRGHRHVLLLVVDGLGDAMLDPGRSPVLCKHQVARLCSVFPTTTATGITCFLTGQPPARHGLTGWHMYVESLDTVMAVLPGTPRGQGPGYGELSVTPRELLGLNPLFGQLPVPSACVSPARIAYSPFNHSVTSAARSYDYTDLPGFFSQTHRAVMDSPGFTYAYWPDLDHLGHVHGARSTELYAHLSALDAGFAKLLEGLAGSDTLILLTADHGMIDAPDRLELDAYPEVIACLRRPLCGEPRVAFAYVHENRHERFRELVNEHFAHCLTLVESRVLLQAGWFGPGPQHPALAGRIGDFTLLMHDGWMVQDRLPGEMPPRQAAVHGGLSEAERLVPLIAVRV